MKRAILCVVAALFVFPSLARAEERQISLDEFRDKVRGAWAGKMVGVVVGFPTEFHFQGKMVPDEAMPVWKP